MNTRESSDAAAVVKRYFERRSSGQRVSIDQVLAMFPDVSDRARVRAEVLHTIVRRTRGGAQAGSSELEALPASVSTDAPTAFPELDGYDIVDCVGRGGMGAVYEAYQQATGRRVAIKFMIVSGRSGDVARRRFEREVELVARLQHPGIVSVLDSGIVRGSYYYVMEYVDGQTFDAYVHQHLIDGAARTTRGVLQLMASVCDAVDYAHQRGVLHRDLKPSNILVDERGQPRLLDFGLAKAMDPTSHEWLDVTLSTPGQLLGTLGYMSPEQSRGEFDQLSVRSDVYSLGAIAYELITGVLASGEGGALGDLLQRIAERDPVPPSRLRPGVSPDVDAILLKALSKSPQARYGTAAELAADLRRFLADESVLARRAGLLSRTRRWIRRNPAVTVVGSSAVLLVALITIVSFTQVVAQRDAAIEARDRAAHDRIAAEHSASEASLQAEKARRANSFLENMLTAADPNRRPETNLTVEEALSQAAERIDTELADQPDVQAMVHEAVGNAYFGLGKYERAERHQQVALDIRQKLYGAEHRDVAQSMYGLGRALDAQSDHDRAEPLLRGAVDLRRRLLGPEHADVADSLNALALMLYKTGDYTEAEQHCVAALDMRRRLHGDEHVDVANGLASLALMDSAQGDYAAAAEHTQQALDVYRKLLGADHPYVGTMLHNLATCLGELGDLDGAEAACRESLAIRSARLGPDHPFVAYDLATLANILRKRKAFTEAEESARAALELRRRVLGPDHPDVADSLDALSQILEDQGHADVAEPLLRESLDIRRRQPVPNLPRMAFPMNRLGVLLRKRGDLDAAEPLLRESLDISLQTFGRQHVQTATYLRSLALLEQARGRNAEAEPLLREAIELRRTLLGDHHTDLAAVISDLASLLHDRGDLAAAEPLYRESLDIARRARGDMHPDVADTLVDLANLLNEKGDEAGSLDAFRQALEIDRNVLGPDSPDLVVSLNNVAMLTLKRGDAAAAEPLFREAVAILRKHADESRSSHCLANLAASLEAQNRHADAEPVYRDAIAVQRAKHPDGNITISLLESRLGDCLSVLGRHDEAEPLLLTSLTQIRAERGDAHPTSQAALQRLIRFYESAGQPDKSNKYRALLRSEAVTSK